MKLYSSLKPEFIKLECTANNAEDMLRELLHSLKIKNIISDEDLILERLLEREKLGSTSIGNHAAVPHTKLKELKEPVICIGTSPNGIQYHKEDKEKVNLVILILSPNYSPIIHLQILAAAASLIKKRGSLIDDLMAAPTAHDLIALIEKYETHE